MTRSNEVQLDQLSVGSKIFYPGHGVALVAKIEERDFGNVKQAFYVLELARGGKLMLPQNKVEQAGVRKLVSATKARELVEQLKADPEIVVEAKTDHAARKARAANYADGLRSGSAERYTAIFHELLVRARTDKLSHGERQAFETARAYFIGEVSVVLGRSPEQVEAELGTVVGAVASG